MKSNFGFRTIVFSLVFCLPTFTAHSQSRLFACGGTTTPQAAPVVKNPTGKI
jgi:hypothetical protein